MRVRCRRGCPSFAFAAVLAAPVVAGCGGSAKTLEVGQPATVSYQDSESKVRATVELTPRAKFQWLSADVSWKRDPIMPTTKEGGIT